MSDAKLGLVQKLELSNMRPWVGDGKDHMMQTLNKWRLKKGNASWGIKTLWGEEQKIKTKCKAKVYAYGFISPAIRCLMKLPSSYDR